MSFSLCQYRDILGKAGEGVHSYRLFGFAIVDVLMTIIVAWLIHRFLLPKYNFFIILAAFFLLGILLHRLFCVRTTIDKMLFHGRVDSGVHRGGCGCRGKEPVPFTGF
jgi:hypothetical protein